MCVHVLHSPAQVKLVKETLSHPELVEIAGVVPVPHFDVCEGLSLKAIAGLTDPSYEHLVRILNTKVPEHYKLANGSILPDPSTMIKHASKSDLYLNPNRDLNYTETNVKESAMDLTADNDEGGESGETASCPS